MKKGKGNGMFKAGGITGPKSCKPEKKRSCIENNMMYIGDGLNVWKRRGNNFGRQKTAARCQDLCKRTRGCKWFNWNSKSQCWLKRSHGQRFAANVRPENGTSTGPRECPIIPAEHRCDDSSLETERFPYEVTCKDCMVLSDSDTILTLTSRDEHFFSYNIASGNATDLAVPFKRSLKVPCVFYMNQDTPSLMVENVIDNMDDIELAGYVYNIETGTWVK